MRSRFQLQEEATECGLACLATICQVHGSHVGLAELRERFPVSLRGTSLERLVEIAGALGFTPRALRVEPDMLGDVRAPAVLHWDMDHFVVLLGTRRNGSVEIFDPASGTRTVTMEEADARFSGIVLELTPGGRFERKPRARGKWLKLPRREGLVRRLGALLVLSVMLQAAVFAAPIFTQWILDEAIGAADASIIRQFAFGLVALTALQMAMHYGRGLGVTSLAAELAMRWSGHVADHLLALPLSFFEKRHLGDIVSRMEAVHVLRRFVTTSTIEAVIDGLVAVAAVCLLATYDRLLATIAVAAVIVYWVVRLATANGIRTATEQHVRAEAKQQSQMLETLRGIRSVKINGREAQRLGAFNNALGDTIGAEARLARVAVRMSTLNSGLFGVERTVILLFGALAVMEGRLTLGMLVAFLGFREIFADRAAALADRVAEIRALGVHLRRVRDLLEAPVEPQGEVPMPRERLRGCIEFKDVWFRYGDDEPWILQGCSFHIDAGQAVVITGPSGCGKSTVLKLILGVLQPSSGSVLVDGVDVQLIRRSDYLAGIGTVLQDDSLFSGSIAYNIAFKGTDIDSAAVEAAARRACVHDDIAAMTMGYSTLVGDMGDSLSGGQRQRIMLARALFRDPRILLLDEATSHLDAARESSIVREIAGMGLTRVVVAHREETIRNGGRVLVLSGGKLKPPVPTHAERALAGVDG